jgi:hypothetical protein
MCLRKYLTGKTKPLPNPPPKRGRLSLKREGLLKITSQFLPPSLLGEGGKGDEVKK